MTSIFGAGEGWLGAGATERRFFVWVWSALLMVEVQKRKANKGHRGNRFSSWYRWIFGVSNSLGRNGLIMAKSQS